MLDTFWRRVVGWSIDLSQTAALVTNALGMAIANRDPQPGVIVHSDHGVQFTSWAFTDRVKPSGLVPSMGSIGDCYDNAVIESFWGRMQTELLDGGTVMRSHHDRTYIISCRCSALMTSGMRRDMPICHVVSPRSRRGCLTNRFNSYTEVLAACVPRIRTACLRAP